ncbi:hypothetical protein OF83DRAFT_1086870 [Amylostereum chailletii]|nr:hypothetical protein OF83DRAFT_1086870 [Amylostereum chailletii]
MVSSTTAASSSPANKTKYLDKLFGSPLTSSVLSLPGATDESSTVLIELLKHNFLHHHAFFNDKGFHNHVMDHLFAAFAMGASPELLKKIYSSHDYQRPVYASPEPITDANFLEHVGDEDYYDAFHVYFCEYLLSHTAAEAIERFIFSNEFNYVPDLEKINAEDIKKGGRGANKQPEMLNRCLAGVLHPHIHLGYGVEFGIVQQVAEGLAQTAIHLAHQTPVIPHSLFEASSEHTGVLSGFSKAISSMKIVSDPSKATFDNPKPFFVFHQALLDDTRLTPDALHISPASTKGYETVVKSIGGVISQYADEWVERWTEGVAEKDLEERLRGMVEEALFGTTLWYGVGGWAARGDRVFNADFFSAHYITSGIFILSMCLPESKPGYLSPPLPLRSRILLVRGYLAVTATWYISQGRVHLPIAEFYAATEKYVHGPLPPVQSEQKGQFFTPGVPYAAPGSAWARIWTNVIVHPNEHLIKLVRALGAMEREYGREGKGSLAGPGGVGKKTLEGSEKLDGTLFVRVAGLTMERLGWAAEGQKLTQWDRDGYFITA